MDIESCAHMFVALWMIVIALTCAAVWLLSYLPLLVR